MSIALPAVSTQYLAHYLTSNRITAVGCTSPDTTDKLGLSQVLRALARRLPVPCTSGDIKQQPTTQRQAAKLVVSIFWVTFHTKLIYPDCQLPTWCWGPKLLAPWSTIHTSHLKPCISPRLREYIHHVCCVQAKKSQDVTANAYVTDAESIRAPKIALLRGQGPVCWDADFYLKHSPDLPLGGIVSAAQAWDHYVSSGQFESRASR